MIRVQKALQLLENNIDKLNTEKRLVSNATGYVLAKDTLSPIDMPSFNQSAMDGYAFNFEEGLDTYVVIGEIAAGSANNPKLNKGEGVRIFTGAMVPDDANIVVQQELIIRENDIATIQEKVEIGKNIRPKGEQIKENTIALNAGTTITPAAVGFLTGIGITEIEVFKMPKITVITTGNELVKPGNTLLQGQIFESNSYMLKSVLDTYKFTNYNIITIPDIYEETRDQIQKAINQSDMLILTGGISVGDYDFVGKALKEIGVEELFYKVKQKPGKPIYMGKANQTIIAALPGNPAAALSCFYIYVLPSLNQMIGKSFKGLEIIQLPLAAEYIKKGNRAGFLKAKIKDGTVAILEMQSSAMLRSFADANGLIFISDDCNKVEKGEQVKVYKF